MLYRWCIFTIVVLLSAISSITAANIYDEIEIDSEAIVVDESGRGHFKSIQAAINSVPSNNRRWKTIDIKPGVYREVVLIPQDKPFIYLKGAGTERTFIVWNAHDNISTSTFTSEAHNTLAKDITFTNSWNYPPSSNRNPVKAAVAAWVGGDKSGFYRCRFSGLQDTLWDDKGRHYFNNCTIEGAIDFIFGAGQSHYEGCTISVTAPNGGFITAQGREEPDNMSGFVLKGCKIEGSGKIFLGRPWRPYARVLFYRTVMSDIVIPKGWDPWFSVGKEDLLTLSEYHCSGPGANSSERVKWEKKLSEGEVEQLTSISFIDNEGWVKRAHKIWAA